MPETDSVSSASMDEASKDEASFDAERVVLLAEKLIRVLGESSRTLVLAESCTAGLISDLLVRVPGASSVFWGSFVCYTMAAKISMLGLDSGRLSLYGPVSRETACDMALEAFKKAAFDKSLPPEVQWQDHPPIIAAAVTGLAGPAGDGTRVPVGTVWIAVTTCKNEITYVKKFHFSGDRNIVRLMAAEAVLEILLDLTEDLMSPSIKTSVFSR